MSGEKFYQNICKLKQCLKDEKILQTNAIRILNK